MTAVPSLKRSATSRASLKRLGSDLWIAEVAGRTGRARSCAPRPPPRRTPRGRDGAACGAPARAPRPGAPRRTPRRPRPDRDSSASSSTRPSCRFLLVTWPVPGSFIGPGRSGPEQRGPDADHRSAFFHRDLVIQRHPHRDFQHIGVSFLERSRGARGAVRTRGGSPRGRAGSGAIGHEADRRRPSSDATRSANAGSSLGATPARPSVRSTSINASSVRPERAARPASRRAARSPATVSTTSA